MSRKIVLALGGNQGNVPETFTNAIKKLEEHGVLNIASSSCYITAPVDCSENAPDFVNAAISGQWDGTAGELLDLCKHLEADAGRPAQYERNADRPLDIDIIFFGDQTINSSQLTVPHKEAANRLFVMVPVAEIEPEFVHPVLGKTAAELLSNLSSNPEYSTILAGKKPL